MPCAQFQSFLQAIRRAHPEFLYRYDSQIVLLQTCSGLLEYRALSRCLIVKSHHLLLPTSLALPSCTQGEWGEGYFELNNIHWLRLTKTRSGTLKWQLQSREPLGTRDEQYTTMYTDLPSPLLRYASQFLPKAQNVFCWWQCASMMFIAHCMGRKTRPSIS